MTTFYDIIDKMKTYLQGNNNINTVTFGDLFEVDLAKQTIFPLAHIIVNSCTFQEHVVRFNMQIICMDIVHECEPLNVVTESLCLCSLKYTQTHSMLKNSSNLSICLIWKRCRASFRTINLTVSF